ncbi:MAG: hypothetical protein U0892_03225 [Pirellulales bacterium]
MIPKRSGISGASWVTASSTGDAFSGISEVVGAEIGVALDDDKGASTTTGA